jgi:hypothetical protein
MAFQWSAIRLQVYKKERVENYPRFQFRSRQERRSEEVFHRVLTVRIRGLGFATSRFLGLCRRRFGLGCTTVRSRGVLRRP